VKGVDRLNIFSIPRARANDLFFQRSQRITIRAAAANAMRR
jgi:hypothetical protein